MRLALAAGVTNVDGMLASMSSRQLTEWMVYAAREPFGEERMDWRFAFLAAVICNLMRGKDTDPVEASDFMPMFGEPDDEPEANPMLLDWIAAMNAGLGGKDIRHL